MKDSILEALRQLLSLTSEAKLLFAEDRLAASSAQARRLLPSIEEGMAAEAVLGPAAEQVRSFSGNGSLLFSGEVAGLSCDLTVADCGPYRLVTIEAPRETVDRSVLLSVSEGIRRPMTAVMAIAPKLLPLLEETSDPKAMDRAAELNRSLYEVMRVTGNLQLCSDTTNLTLRRERIDMELWLQELTDRIGPVCGGVSLAYQSAGESCICAVDRELMERALLNLISNAIKFSNPGDRVLLLLKKNRLWARITVQDQGCGIPADQMAAVFRRSECRGQLPDPRWGAGFGLSIAKTIVQAHRGSLMLESQEGVGTRAHISLRLHTGREQLIRSQIRLPDYSGGIDHVLMELSDVLPAEAFDTRGVDL